MRLPTGGSVMKPSLLGLDTDLGKTEFAVGLDCLEKSTTRFNPETIAVVGLDPLSAECRQ